MSLYFYVVLNCFDFFSKRQVDFDLFVFLSLAIRIPLNTAKIPTHDGPKKSNLGEAMVIGFIGTTSSTT